MPSCPVLDDYGIRHLGVVNAGNDYKFVRERPRETLFLACFAGRGMVDGGSSPTELAPGGGALMPRQQPRSFYTLGPQSWHFAWMCFHDPGPFNPGSQVRCFDLDAGAFRLATEAVMKCWTAYQDPKSTGRMVEALIGLVELHARVKPELERFHAGWHQVAAELAAPWTVSSLARLCACSTERFRQCCWSEFGCSPAKYLTLLRLRAAKRLLYGSRLTLDEVSAKIGYSDSYAFSHAFKRCFGLSPREFRGV